MAFNLLRASRSYNQAGRAALEGLPDGVILFDRGWRITYCNPSCVNLLPPAAAGPGKLIGRDLWKVFPQIVGSPVESRIRQAVQSGQPDSVEFSVEPDEMWLEVRTFPGPETSIFVRDITAVKRQQTAIEEHVRKVEVQAHLCDTTLSNITDMAYSFDCEGRFTYVNRRVMEFFDLRVEEIIGRQLLALKIPEEFAHRLHGQVIEVVKTGKPIRDETRVNCERCTTEYHEYTLNPVFASDGVVLGVAGSTRNITERKRAQARGEAQRRVLQYMAENRPLPEVLDALARMVELQSDSPMFASIMLFDEDGMCLRHGAGPSLPAEYNRQIDGVAIGPLQGSCGSAAYLKKPVAVADIEKDPRWVGEARELAATCGLRACWSMPIMSTQGNLLGTFSQYYREPREPGKHDWRVLETATRTAAIAIDRRRVEAALRQSEAKFRRLSDSAPVPIWISDAAKACIWANKAFLEFTGRALEQVVGRAFEAIIHHDDLEACMQQFDRCFDARKEFEVECRVRHHDGRWRWWFNRGIPLYGSANEFTGYIGSCVDITDQREVQADLERLVTQRTVKLTETNAQLETLVYSIAHDLRAPLRSLQSFAVLLTDEHQSGVSGDAQIYAARIARAASGMDALVTDLLAYGQVARSELELKRTDVLPAWRAALAHHEADIESRGAHIENASRFPLVHAHEGMLVQVLANLLGNALKFVAPGKAPRITFRAEEFGRTVRLWVEDNGIGIAPHHQDRIFRVFERLHGREYGGTGIGLSIVSKGVERMNGKVGVISAEGEGARFWIELAKG